MSSLDIYKVIGQGSYGCVIKPPLKCNSQYKDIDYNNKVSKLMAEIEAHKEMIENDKIYRLKDIEKYVLPKPILCKPEISDDNIRKMLDNELKKCTYLKNGFFNSKFKLLLLEDGGEDLVTFTKTYNSYKDPASLSFERLPLIDKIEFFKSLIHLFDTIIFFRKNNLVHHDIKLSNIVYNIDTKKSFLIDFGLLTTDDSIKDNTYEFLVSHKFYPPESSCIHKNDYLYRAKCEKYKDKMSYDDYVKKHIDTFDSYSLSLSIAHMIYSMYERLKYSSLDLKTKNALRKFYTNIWNLLIKYYDKDIFQRATDLYYLRDQYIFYLQSFIDECKAENLITEDIQINTKLPDDLLSRSKSASPKSKKRKRTSSPPKTKKTRKNVQSPLSREEQYRNYTYRQLQLSAKKYGIKANQKAEVMRKKLSRRPK